MRSSVLKKSGEKILSLSIGPLTPKVIESLNGCIVVLDTETTGFSQYKDRIVEFGAIKLQGGKVIKKLDFLINPGFPMRQEVIDIHGITDSMVIDKPYFDKYIPELLELFSDCDIVVGHNVAFDIRFITESFKRSGYNFDCTYLDTLEVIKKGNFSLYNSSNKLCDVAKSLGIETPNSHRALADVETTLMVLRHLCYLTMKKYSK